MKHRVFEPSPIEVRFQANPSDIRITSSRDAYEVLLDQYDSETLDLREVVRLMMLDSSNRVLGVTVVSVGTEGGALIDAPLIIAIIVAMRAASYVIYHNHPSGNLSPSKADVRATEDLVKISDVIGIPLFDHLIITRDGYLSMAWLMKELFKAALRLFLFRIPRNGYKLGQVVLSDCAHQLVALPKRSRQLLTPTP